MSDEFRRYHRQMLLPGFGQQGQLKLFESTALILGCGALGTVSANMLARAGVGHLVIADRDFIELTNLQRQVLFDEQDVSDAIPKAEAARRRIARINSQTRVTAIVDDVNSDNIERLAAGVDVIIDGLDNLETRYLANDCAVKHGLPFLYGGAVGTAGLAYVILPHTKEKTTAWETFAGGSKATPCFRCIFEEAPAPGELATCDTAGVIGPAASIIANFQVAEALKLLTGNLEQVCPTLLNIDLWTNMMTQLKVNTGRENGDCPCCKQRHFEFLEGRAGSKATTLCGNDAVQLAHRQQEGELNLDEIAGRLRSHGPVKVNRFMVRAGLSENGSDFELTLFADGRAIVKGTRDPAVARGVFAKYIGI